MCITFTTQKKKKGPQIDSQSKTKILILEPEGYTGLDSI